MRKIVNVFLILLFLSISGVCSAEQVITAVKTDKAPVIDGIPDSVWEKAPAFVTHDKIAGIDITLKAVYTDKKIFFLVSFPDPDESREHKTWVWDKEMQIYKQGPLREDTFVFKWNMGPGPVDLSIKADNNYTADIWFWKACRTDPSGYADDKYQRYNSKPEPKSYEIISKSGKKMYVIRKGDKGKAAYKDILYADYEKDTMPTYNISAPEGSRADVKAKGEWKDSVWIVEFSRDLDTGNDDDVQFDISKTYLFGVSRHEIAGRPEDPNISQPLYGGGDVSEVLILKFNGSKE